MMKRIALIFGGKSPEHEISVMGAKDISKTLISMGYEVEHIGIDTEGNLQVLNEMTEDDRLSFGTNKGLTQAIETLQQVDLAFPLLHGPNGEDGTVQGFLKTLGVRHVGCDTLQSSVTMDKDYTKHILKNAGIPMDTWCSIRRGEKIPEHLEFPIFVKPAGLGSSIGVSKVKNYEELERAVASAFCFDEKLLLEKAVDARELECGILCGEISGVGEIIPSHEFYDYEAKYSEDAKSRIIVPAQIPEEVRAEIRGHAEKICSIFGIYSISRIDFFYDRDGKVLFNEINTIPGFTRYSMYSLLFKEAGYTSEEILRKLIEAVDIPCQNE